MSGGRHSAGRLDNHRNPVATSSRPGGEPGHVLVDTQMEITMTTGTEALVRRAYHLAEGDVLDVQGFMDLFTEDGVFNGIGGVSGHETYRGEQLGDVIVWMGKFLPDVHRELHRVNVLGDVVAIELSIRGTFLGPFETPAGVIQPTGAKLDIPAADFWYVRDGKIQEFNCHIGITTMFAQLGVLPDFTSAVAASAPE
jgi:ketosteroid isomerase-like protein